MPLNQASHDRCNDEGKGLFFDYGEHQHDGRIRLRIFYADGAVDRPRKEAL
jgi:hypothetical protein